jgi:N-methylhydantoinase A/oxoprolinase/acetone carboxylase beta subunit/N-methylhydantoinase B/oxoprolinase/acetone carboxylase alpha subunit
MLRIATDTGGTFTDLLLESPDGLRQFKAPTTPSDPIGGVLDVLDLAASDLGVDRRELLSATSYFFHATTRAINAILTGEVARTAFLTTDGHPDILLFREGGRLRTFDFTRPYPDPYIPRALTYQACERVSATGEVLCPLDLDHVTLSLRDMRERRVEAIGVCLLWSPVNPVHELQIGDLIETELPGVPYTLSHQLNPTLREYRRASSTVIDASLKPLMSQYLADFDERLRLFGFEGRLLVVTSSGGMLDASAVAAAPIHAIGSGPAMAPIAGKFFASEDLAAQDVIVADTGGTTFDVSLVRRGRVPSTRETWLGPMYSGHITGFPSVDVRSIGAGGGSLAWVDEGGLLHVGPESAGAVPGPACYGRGGTRPTVTDACVVLGYLDASQFLGGRMSLDPGAAAAALARDVGGPLTLDVEEAAAAVLELATEHMVAAIEEVTLKQGVDPRHAVLAAGGGAAGLNAFAIARRLGCQTVLVPAVGPVLSAAGALLSDVRRDFGTAFHTTTAAFDFGGARTTLSELEQRCLTFISEVGSSLDQSEIEFFAEARYPHQVYELDLPLVSNDLAGDVEIENMRSDFHRLHQEVFSICDPNSHVELMGWRAAITCRLGSKSIPALTHQATAEPATRGAYFAEAGLVETCVVQFDAIRAESRIDGPAIIESALTTVVVPPGAWAERTDTGGIALHPAEYTARYDGESDRALDLAGARLPILANRFESIVLSMMNTLVRTGRSGVLNTGRDFSCCVLTRDDELLAMAESQPIHVMSGPDLMARVMKKFHEPLVAGDAFLHNSPYHGNSHAADYSILVPVVDDAGEHRFTLLAKAHQADCGNALPTTYSAPAVDVYEEGALIFPCVRVQERYRDRMDIIRMCEMRIRVPEQWRGDYLALLGAARIGERRIRELGGELGWDLLHAYTQEWFDYSERLMASAIHALPDGEIVARSQHDPFPGVPSGVPLTARVRVKKQEGEVEVDLRENPDCQPCGLNLTEATARTSAMLGVFNAIGGDVPPNAGSFRRLRILLRENCVVGIPRHPASCSVATTNLADRVANMVQRSFAELCAGVGLAEAGLTIPPAWGVISGTDVRSGRQKFVNQLILAACTGGPGAPHADGWLTLGGPGDAGMEFRDSVELDELRFPLRIHAQYVVPDTEGAGAQRGAPAAYVEYGPTHEPLQILYTSDGTVYPALGTREGLPGATARQYRRDHDGRLHELESFGNVRLVAGETIISISCGGGGYGSPLDRDPRKVAADVAEGWISRDRALNVYGVVLTADGSIDREATETQRHGLRARPVGSLTRLEQGDSVAER